MRPLLRIAWRNATSSLGRTAMMLVAVCLGVAFLSSALAMSNTMARNLSVLFSSQYTGVDVVVRGEVVAFGQRADLSTDVLDEIEAVEGVAATAGIVEGFAQPIAMDGSPLGSPQQPGRGRSWVSDPQLQSLPMLQGNGPTTADEVALDRTTAEKGGVAIGDSIQLATPNEVVTMTVSGVVDVSSGTGSALSWLHPAEAQELLGQPGLVQEILVAGGEGVAPEELASDVAAQLDAGADVLTGAQAAEESQKKVEAVFGFFRVILLVFVGIGLLVCAFIVYNTFAVLTAQRTRQLATLRALGCGQGQVMASTLAEGAVLGVIGSVLGVLVGWLGSALLTRIITAAGLGEFPDGVELSASVVLISLAVGVSVTLVGAYPSARTAGRSRPVAAMREVSGTSTAVSLGQILLGLFGFVVGVLLVGRGATTGYPDGLGDVAIGALALILGLVAWGRTVIVGIVAILAPGASRWGGLPGALAGRNSVRDPKRTTVTAGSLALGLTLVSSLAVLGASTKATLTDAADAGLTADVLVLPLIGQTPMPAVVTDQVSQTPGVAASTPILFDTALIESRPTFVSGVDPDDVGKVITLDMQSGSADTLGQGELLVARSVAQSRGLRVGDEVRAVFAASGPVERRIGGVFQDNVYAGYWLLAADDFEMLSGKSGVWYVYAKAESGTSPDQVRDAVATEIEGTANTQAMTYEQFTSYQDDLVDQALAGMYFMLLFAVIVAVVGVANTVALSVSERTREIGVLRAVGLPRPGVSRMIRLEAVMTCVAGAALGTIVGIFLGASLRLTLDNIGFTTLAVPWPTIVMIFVLASLSGVLAAYVPARRAANLDILEAIRAT